MNKHSMLMLTLCALQTTHTARPVIDTKPAPITTQMQMTNTVIAATTPTVVEAQVTPQPIQISEQHLAGHAQPQTLVEQAPQTTVSIKTADPVAMPVAVQLTDKPALTQKPPVTLTPNTPGTVTPEALKKQLQDLQEHLATVTQQIDLMNARQN